MKRNSLPTFVLFSFLLTPLVLDAQYYDGQWVFGYGEEYSLKFGLSQLDFNGSEVDLSYYGPVGQPHYDLNFAGSFLCDKAGKLKFHTNNCAVYDTAWNRILGPDIITPTGEGAQSCGSMGNVPEMNYGSLQSSILLPDLVDSTITYVLHKDMVLDFENQDGYTENFYFSTIHERHDGSFDFKTKYTINEKKLDLLDLTALPNKAKDAWWILIPRHNSNVFERYLVQSDTVLIMEAQMIGEPVITNEKGIGQTQYSPKGNYLGINTGIGIFLYEFDNESGMLSDFRRIPYPNSDKVAKGLCFSSNERFIYVTTAEDVYQIDLEQNDEVYHIGYFRSWDETGWPVGLGMIFQGPDCRLYVSPGSTTYYMHVIMEPDKKGAASEFIERGIELPTIIGGHLPNIAQYRHLTGCDSSKEIPFVKTSVISPSEMKSSITLYPNPAYDLLRVKSDKPIKSYSIYSIYGTRLQSDILHNSEIDISELSSGTYFLSLEYIGGGKNVEKFVKM